MTQQIVDDNEPSQRLAQAARIVAVLRDCGEEWMEVLVVVLKVVTTTDALKPRRPR